LRSLHFFYADNVLLSETNQLLCNSKRIQKEGGGSFIIFVKKNITSESLCGVCHNLELHSSRTEEERKKKSSENQRCSQCKSIYYCSKKHQKKHWNQHQHYCTRIAKNPKKYEQSNYKSTLNRMIRRGFLKLLTNLHRFVNQFPNKESIPGFPFYDKFPIRDKSTNSLFTENPIPRVFQGSCVTFTMTGKNKTIITTLIDHKILYSLEFITGTVKKKKYSLLRFQYYENKNLKENTKSQLIVMSDIEKIKVPELPHNTYSDDDNLDLQSVFDLFKPMIIEIYFCAKNSSSPNESFCCRLKFKDNWWLDPRIRIFLIVGHLLKQKISKQS